MNTIADPSGQRRNVQLPHFVLDPPPIDIPLWLSHMNLGDHHGSLTGSLFFDSVRIILRLETAQVDLHVLFGHEKALVTEKLLDGVNVNALLDHVGGDGMAKLMW